MFNCSRGMQLAKPTLWYFLAAKQTCLFNEYTEQTNKIQQTKRRHVQTELTDLILALPLKITRKLDKIYGKKKKKFFRETTRGNTQL